MNHQDKPMAIASLSNNWSAFNDREVLAWKISQTDAAAILLRARNLRARGRATISVELVGRYRLSTFNTFFLNTKRTRLRARRRQAGDPAAAKGCQVDCRCRRGWCRAAIDNEKGRKVRDHRDIGGLINFRVAQALLHSFPNGHDDASGASGWQRRCQFDQDVPEDIQPCCDRLKIA